MSGDRDTAWRDLLPLAARLPSTLMHRPEGNSPKAELPVGGTLGWDDRAYDKSWAYREPLLLIVHTTRLLPEMHMQIHGMPAAKPFGDENGSVKGENGNEIENEATKWRARMTNKNN